MNSWLSETDLSQLPEWQTALAVASQLEEAFARLELKQDREWLQTVLARVVVELRASITWAMDSESPSGLKRSSTDQLADYVVAADAARGSAVFASYCLDFMRAENLIDEEALGSLPNRLIELQRLFSALARRLRENPPLQKRFANN
jgi:hypothetical protein